MGILQWLWGNKTEPVISESRITNVIDKSNATEIATAGDGCGVGQFFQYSSNSKMADTKTGESRLIEQYREYSQMAEVEGAVDDIISEAVVADVKGNSVEMCIDKVITDDRDVTNLYKTKIPERFERILTLMNFNDNGYRYIKDFYVDGRQYVYVEFSKGKGITDIRFVDTLKMKKVNDTTDGRNYHYEYNTGVMDIRTGKPEIIKMSRKNVFLFTSGLINKDGVTISNLHKAIRPINNLKMMENSLVVYRFSRAPERLIFKINVTGMSDKNATPYIQQMITDHKSRTSIDSVTGEITAQSTLMAMQENYWFAEKNGNSHSISSLPGGQNLGEIADVLYFLKKMYKSLNVPVSRLQEDASFSWGRSDEISRDEQKFFRFIKRFRRTYEMIFQKMVEIDIINMDMTNEEDWKKYISNGIDYIWANDSVYEESSKLTKHLSRIEAAKEYDDLVDQGYYSKNWVKKNILLQTDLEIRKMEKEIKKEEQQHADRTAEKERENVDARDKHGVADEEEETSTPQPPTKEKK